VSGRRLQRAALRLADHTSERIRAATGGDAFLATIGTVTAGAAADGNALVTVDWRAGTVEAAGYLSSYTPVVGHRVLCELVDNQLIITGRVVGYP
jgi:hypothetical protein